LSIGWILSLSYNKETAEVILYLVLLNSVAAIWIAFEIWLVVRDHIQGKGKTGKDRGTVYYNFIAITLGITSAGIISGYSKLFFPGGRTSTVFAIGLIIMVLGLALRIWAVWALGASFRTTVETHEYQKVKSDGPYRFVRHPSYSGLLLISCGYGIAVQNWLSLIIAIGLPLTALLYRIHVEEALLVKSLGSEYEDYQKYTKRLIPWIW
jgi:protein-S-isoprenylcysteine O-methyltransferase Ste14